MVQTPTRTNDASMEMMAVRIMTQSPFSPDFPGCVSLMCMFHRTTGTLYSWAMHRYQSTRRPGADRSISWLRMETRVSTIRIVYGKRGSRNLLEVRHSPLTSGKLSNLQFPRTIGLVGGPAASFSPG